jgi:signal peptidase I
MRILYVVVGLCVVLGIVAWAFVFNHLALANVGFPPHSYSIPSSSMQPTVRLGEMIFATAGAYRDHGPESGDVVIFLVQDGNTFIKRVVAGPGDRVRMEAGRLFINGAIVDRTPLADFAFPEGAPAVRRYLETLPNGRAYEIIEAQGDTGQLDTMAEITVGEGRYFVLGDNRDNSVDSRLPKVDQVARDQLTDRPSIVWFSTDLQRIGKDLQPAP